MQTNIMIVEDDRLIGETIIEYSKDAGFAPTLFADGLAASAVLQQEHPFDLFVLDIMLPGISGLELLNQIRASDLYKQTPVIMLTALGDETTQILSFNSLADDYVTKPFSPKILLKRITALLRRSGTSLGNTLTQGDISMDTDSYQVWENQQKIDLTLREFEILRTLMQNSNRVYTRQDLLNQAWGYDYFGDERIVDVHIKNLRKKFLQNIIRTVKGVGYQMTDKNEVNNEKV